MRSPCARSPIRGAASRTGRRAPEGRTQVTILLDSRRYYSIQWQYTAIDLGSASVWVELHVTPRNPSARWTSQLARRVAYDVA